MKIQEAIKSGKPFKRRIHNYWMKVGSGDGRVILSERNHCQYTMNETDILATDWEIKAEPFVTEVTLPKEIATYWITPIQIPVGHGLERCAGRKAKITIEVIE